jgi:hypothetical protein
VALYDLEVRLEGAEEAVATTAAEWHGTTPALETLRCELYWKLRHSLERHCRAETPPVELCPLAFERWQFNCMLQRHEAGTARSHASVIHILFLGGAYERQASGEPSKGFLGFFSPTPPSRLYKEWQLRTIHLIDT